MNETSKAFIRTIRNRSSENEKIFQYSLDNDLLATAVSTMRLEIDSMIRVIYLTNIEEIDYRQDLIKSTFEGRRWRDSRDKSKNKYPIITDRIMVDFAEKLNGTTNIIYKFGCSFIHLSNYHDYKENDPFLLLSDSESHNVKKLINYYYSEFSMDNELSIPNILPYLDSIYYKVRAILRDELERLELILSDKYPGKITGKISSIKHKKGRGYINDEIRGNYLYFTKSGIIKGKIHDFQNGDLVEYDITEVDGKRKAFNIKKIEEEKAAANKS